jgi:hypothetical protein
MSTRIYWKTKNEIGELESSVVERVFGMALAIFPTGKSERRRGRPSGAGKFNSGSLLNRHT